MISPPSCGGRWTRLDPVLRFADSGDGANILWFGAGAKRGAGFEPR